MNDTLTITDEEKYLTRQKEVGDGYLYETIFSGLPYGDTYTFKAVWGNYST